MVGFFVTGYVLQRKNHHQHNTDSLYWWLVVMGGLATYGWG